MKKLTISVLSITFMLAAMACNKPAPAANNNNAGTNANNSNTAKPAENKNTSSDNTNKATTSSNSGDNTLSHQEAGLKFAPPAGWKQEPNGDTIQLTSPDNSVAIVITTMKADNLQAAASAIDTEIGKIIKNVEPSGEPETTEHNGMSVVSQEGTGDVDGQEIEWGVYIFLAKQPVMFLSFAEKGAYEKHGEELSKFVESIQKL